MGLSCGCSRSHKRGEFADVIAAFHHRASHYVTLAPEEWLAMDGNALASTVTDDETCDQNVVSLVSVFSHQRGHVLKTVTVENQKCRERLTAQTFIAA